MGRKQAHRAMH